MPRTPLQTDTEPISPELCLIDPELARAARERLPGPPVEREQPEQPEPEKPAIRSPGAARPQTARRRSPPAPPVRRRLPRPRPALVRVAAVALALGALVPAMPSASVHGVSPVRTERPAEAATPEHPALLVVPDVCRLAYVFAKGALQDAGFAWKVEGDVQGFAANLVVSQTPEPGTLVLDKGTPTLTLKLERNPRYRERGTPEEGSPYDGTQPRFWALGDANAPVFNACERGLAGDPPARPGY